MRGNATSPARINAREKQRRALELRKTGATYEQIAAAVGYMSSGAAQYAIKAALERISPKEEDIREVRALEIQRLDSLLMTVWPRARAGDDAAIRHALTILDRRARYLGLYAPTQVDIRHMILLFAQGQGLSIEDTFEAVDYLLPQAQS